jgi:aromatic ring hydroxylase
MALKTKAEYIEDLKEVKPTVYYLGEKVDRICGERKDHILNIKYC